MRPIAVLLVPSSFSVPFCFPNTLPLVGAAHLLGFAFLDGVRGVSKDSIRGGLRGRFEGLFALKGCLNRGGKVGESLGRESSPSALRTGASRECLEERWDGVLAMNGSEGWRAIADMGEELGLE